MDSSAPRAQTEPAESEFGYSNKSKDVKHIVKHAQTPFSPMQGRKKF